MTSLWSMLFWTYYCFGIVLLTLAVIFHLHNIWVEGFVWLGASCVAAGMAWREYRRTRS